MYARDPPEAVLRLPQYARIQQCLPKLDGKVRYQIPEGTQTGTTFRLRGKGIPYVGYKTRGDQFVTVVVETPTKLTREQKELLKQLESSVGDDGQPKRKSFFDKLKG